MKQLGRFVIFLAFACLISQACWAQEDNPKLLQGVEFLSGFGTGQLVRERDYQLVPLFVDFDFDLRSLLTKRNINPPGLLQFVLEPFVSFVTSPNNNAEFGNNFLIKIGILPETSKFQPYFKGGVGLLYMTQHIRDQGTQFNFNELAGIGMHYFFQKNIALTLEYRFRHLSNSGIKKPNHGINNDFGLCGISCLF